MCADCPTATNSLQSSNTCLMSQELAPTVILVDVTPPYSRCLHMPSQVHFILPPESSKLHSANLLPARPLLLKIWQTMLRQKVVSTRCPVRKHKLSATRGNYSSKMTADRGQCLENGRIMQLRSLALPTTYNNTLKGARSQ